METLNTTLKLNYIVNIIYIWYSLFFLAVMLFECNKFKGLRDLLFLGKFKLMVYC